MLGSLKLKIFEDTPKKTRAGEVATAGRRRWGRMYRIAIVAVVVNGHNLVFAASALAIGQILTSRSDAIDHSLNAASLSTDLPTSGVEFAQGNYSPLSLINSSNVATLGYAWSYDLHTVQGLEATPVVVDEVMYASAPWGIVHAVDARTGRGIWSFDPRVGGSITGKVCCGVVNRGLAVSHGYVFVASLDGQLFALSAKTGKVAWHVDTIVDHDRGYTVTGAVYVANDVAVIGNSGADLDARGYVSAYNIRDGALRWRFFTVPSSAAGPFENPELILAARSWDPRSRWEVGLGGTVWGGMAYDRKLNLLYFGTGNGEVYSRKLRSPAGGDNLFLCSILAVHADTGQMAWYYQEVPGDQWDFDANANLVIADLDTGGHRREVLLQAAKDGFFYVLERSSGELLSAQPYVDVTWASHIDKASGRPVETAQGDYSQRPRLVFPSIAGGHNWQPMAFNPHTRLVYIPTIEAGAVFWMPTKPFVYDRGGTNVGTMYAWPALDAGDMGLESQSARSLPAVSELARGQPDITIRGFLRAWDPVSSRIVWEVETSGQWTGKLNAMWNGGGVLTTAGGLVFQGQSTGYLYAYRADNGQRLAVVNVGTSMMAAPMTYEIDGVQYVALLAGFGGALGGSYAEGTAARRYGNSGRIVVFKLGGGSVPLPKELAQVPLSPKPLIERFGSEATIDLGNTLLKRYCSGCHVNNGAIGAVPDLRRMSVHTQAQFEEIVLGGTRAAKGMRSFAEVLSVSEAQAILAALVDASWREYEAERTFLHSPSRAPANYVSPADSGTMQ